MRGQPCGSPCCQSRRCASRRLAEVVKHVVAPLRIGDVERRIGMEYRQHLHGESLFPDLAVPLEVVLRMVSREDRLDIALLQERAHCHRAICELLRADRPDIICRLSAEHVVAVKDALEHEMDPRVERIARRPCERLREVLEALARRCFAARDEALLDAIGAHEPPRDGIVDEHLRQIVVDAVLRNVPHGDVRVVVEDRQLLGIFVIQVFRKFRVQEKIFIHKTFHDSQPRFPIS